MSHPVAMYAMKLLTAINSKTFLQLITLIFQDFTEIMNNFVHNAASMHTKHVQYRHMQNRLHCGYQQIHQLIYVKLVLVICPCIKYVQCAVYIFYVLHHGTGLISGKILDKTLQE